MTRQHGGALIITLIAVAMLLLGGMSMLRSTSAANAIATNAATKQAAVEAADIGLQAAALALSTLANPEAGVAGSYFATQQPVDGNGLPAVDWSAVPVTNVGPFRVQTLIDRLCDAPLPVVDTAVQCAIAPTTGQAASHRVGSPVFVPNAPVYYRMTARVVGPKSSESYVQAVMSR